MKVLTICQPYARLICIGEKQVENRTWETKHRGDLLIHAGKSRSWLGVNDEAEAAKANDPLIFGAIVAVCRVVDCLTVERLSASPQRRLLNSRHCFGPWCWILADVRRVKPVYCGGKQGLWNADLPQAVGELL